MKVSFFSLLLSSTFTVSLTHAAKPIQSSTEDLISYGSQSVFNNVVALDIKQDNTVHWCSATKIKNEAAAEIFLTAAHCVEGMTSLWINGVKASWSFTHPLYQNTPLYDLAIVAFNDLPTRTVPWGYPLCAPTPEMLMQAELSSVGYGSLKDGTTPRQAFRFYPDWISPFLITQDAYPPVNVAGPFGLMTSGESGGPLLMKSPDEHFCIAGVLSNGGNFDSSVARIPSAWKAFLTHFLTQENINHLAQLNGTGVQSYILNAFLPFLEKPREDMIASLQTTADMQYYTACGYDADGKSALAFDLFLQAAQQGHPPAMYNVANMLFNGDGVPRNRAHAKIWFERAAKSGDRDALNMLRRFDLQSDL